MARTGAVRRAGGAAVRGNKRSRSGDGSVRPPYGPGPSPDGEPTPRVHHVESPVTPRITGDLPSNCAFLQLPALPLGQTAPDAEALVLGQRVLKALVLDLATQADPLGFAGGAALLREERLRVRLRAQGAFLPILLFFGGIDELGEISQSLLRDLAPTHDVPPFLPIGFQPHVRLLAP